MLALFFIYFTEGFLEKVGDGDDDVCDHDSTTLDDHKEIPEDFHKKIAEYTITPSLMVGYI